MRVRPYAAADLDALIALFRDSVRTLARRDYTLEQVLAWAPDAIDAGAWALRFAANSTWVAALGTRAAGFIGLESGGHLDTLFVHPDFQGRGVARMLLQRLEASAKACGLLRLFTEASITARPFFERHGYRVVQPQTAVRRGQRLVSFRMERPLDESSAPR